MPNVRPVSGNLAYCQGSYSEGSGSNPKSSVNPDQAYRLEDILASIRAHGGLSRDDKIWLERLVDAATIHAPPLPRLVTLRDLQDFLEANPVWSAGDYTLSQFPEYGQRSAVKASDTACDIHTLTVIMSSLEPFSK